MAEQINSVFRNGDWTISKDKLTGVTTFSLKDSDVVIYADFENRTIETNFNNIYASFNENKWMQEYLDALFDEEEIKFKKKNSNNN